MKLFENNTAESSRANLAFLPIVKAKRDGKYIVAVQEEGTKIPVFVVQGYFYFQSLAQHLEKDQPVYCLDFSPHTKIQDIAAHYISEIKNVQGDGPYILGGFCHMGNIALEIAEQLSQKGDQVAVVLLFESYAPKAKLNKASVKYIRHKTSVYKKQLMGVSLKDVLLFFFKVFKNKIKSELSDSQQFRKRYAGKVVLFRATIQTMAMKETRDMGWSPLISGGMEIYEIDADHTTFFREPAITQLAKYLQVIFERENKHLLLPGNSV